MNQGSWPHCVTRNYLYLCLHESRQLGAFIIVTGDSPMDRDT